VQDLTSDVVAVDVDAPDAAAKEDKPSRKRKQAALPDGPDGQDSDAHFLVEGKRCFNPSCEAKASDGKKLYRCKGCHQAWYCGQQCQVAHSKRHQKECKSAAADPVIQVRVQMRRMRCVVCYCKHPNRKKFVLSDARAYDDLGPDEWDWHADQSDLARGVCPRCSGFLVYMDQSFRQSEPHKWKASAKDCLTDAHERALRGEDWPMEWSHRCSGCRRQDREHDCPFCGEGGFGGWAECNCADGFHMGDARFHMGESEEEDSAFDSACSH